MLFHASSQAELDRVLCPASAQSTSMIECGTFSKWVIYCANGGSWGTVETEQPNGKWGLAIKRTLADKPIKL